jgi:hypothetical protein
MSFTNPLALAPTVIEELGKEFFARFEASVAVNKESQVTACYRLALRSTSLLLGMGRVVELATFDSFEVLTRAFLESSDLLLTFRFDDAGTRERIETWFEGRDGKSWKPDHNKCEEFLRNLGRGESQLGTRWSVFSALSHPTKYATDNSVGYAELWIKRLRPPDAGEMHIRRIADYRKRTVLAVWTGLISVGILPSGHSGCVHLEVRWMLRIPQ